MTREEAIRIAKEMAKMYKLPAYVHTDPVIGFNFRFMKPIEAVIPKSKCRTVFIAYEDGTGQFVSVSTDPSHHIQACIDEQ